MDGARKPRALQIMIATTVLVHAAPMGTFPLAPGRATQVHMVRTPTSMSTLTMELLGDDVYPWMNQ
jgi:hypothetical protein